MGGQSIRRVAWRCSATVMLVGLAVSGCVSTQTQKRSQSLPIPSSEQPTSSFASAPSTSPSPPVRQTTRGCHPHRLYRPQVMSMQFVGATGWAVGASGVLETVDGGSHWDVVPVGVRQPSLVDFIDSEHGWIAGADGLWGTRDGGRSWRRLPAIAGCSPVTSLHFVSATSGHAITRANGADPLTGRSVLRATSDGGRTWRRLPAPMGAQSVCFQDRRTGWLGGSYGVYVTTDGGRVWLSLAQHPIGWSSPSFVTVECSGNGLAWALSSGPGGASSQSPHIGYRLTATSATPLFAEQYFPHPRVTVRPGSAGSYPGPFSALLGAAAYVDWCPSCGRGTAPWLVARTGSDQLERMPDVAYLTRPTAASFTTETTGCVAGENTRWPSRRVVARIVCTSDAGHDWSIRWESTAAN